MGVSSISHIGPYMFQNSPNMGNLHQEIDAGKMPIVKGLEEASRDDQIPW